jgi:histone H3/H4
MLKSSVRIARLFVLSFGIAATTAMAQPGTPRGGPAAHAAPVPHASPAPHISAPPAPHISAPQVAPQLAAPRIAPQMTAPRVVPQMAAPRVAPQQLGRPSGGPPPAAIVRAEPTSRTFAAPPHERSQLGGQGRPNLAQPNLRDNLVGQHREGGDSAAPSARIGRNATQQNLPAQNSQNQPSRIYQLPGGNRAASDRVLRNQFFADRSAARDPNARLLARSTFQGRFFDPRWRLHRDHPIVIGWAGPLFWPYAYNDVIDYTFYPYAYDTFWPYAYDDVYDGMFGTYAQGYGGTYAAVGRPRGSSSGRSVGADLCAGQTAGLTDWPIERIAQTVEPDDAQRTALDELKDATAQALDILKASCPTALPSTPTGRLEAMRQRLDAMVQAVRMVRPAVEKFYQSLNDEQKARLNALGADDTLDQQQVRRDLTQVCGERASGIASLPMERIERAVRPDEVQRSALKELQDAASDAVNLLKSDCPTDRALTPVVRLEAMEQRLDAMLRAVQTVQPALEKFYGSLGDEQKERFNRLNPA